MAIHLCRDFETVAHQPHGLMCLMAMYLTGVLGYRTIGRTNCELSMSTRGSSASINMGAGSELAVYIPSSTYVLSANNIGSILALRSTLNPRHNSGLFRITSVNTASNYAFVDYRTSGSNPPAETGTLNFTLFRSELNFTSSVGRNSQPDGSYRGDRDSNSSRITLRSPHSSSWDVRIAREPMAQSETGGYDGTSFEGGNPLSLAPGMNSDVFGDFPAKSLDRAIPSGEHLHGQMWFDTQNYPSSHAKVGTGLSQNDSTATLRFYAWGDDETGTTIFAYRIISNSYGPSSLFTGQWCGFGMVDLDGETLPPKTVQRLFTFGHTYNAKQAFIFENYSYGHINWKIGPPNQHTDTRYPNQYTGITFGLNDEPVSACVSPYVEIGGANTGITNDSATYNHIIDVSFAVDNAVLGSTELHSVDLYAGTYRARVITLEDRDVNDDSYQVFDFDPRRMGLFPIAKFGRSNLGRWVTTTDVSSSWVHADGGVYLPWGGPSIL